MFGNFQFLSNNRVGMMEQSRLKIHMEIVRNMLLPF